MKKIWSYLVEYFKEDFNVKFYLVQAIFLSTCIFFNYKYNFENDILESYKRSIWHFIFTFIYYATPYYFTALTYSYFHSKANFIKSKIFWIVSLFAISTLTINECFYWHRVWLENTFNVFSEMWFIRKCANNFVSFFLYLLPLFSYWFFVDRKKMSFYGLSRGRFEYKPYIVMMLFMFPLITMASFQDDFQQSYPIYKDFGVTEYWNIPKIYTIIIFEFFYGLDFVSVELFFRGFLILALAEVMGKGVIMPMVSLYCIIHFGKPMGEAISSIFGGAILGIIAYYSKSIYGGICIHLGVAFSMELAAFLQTYLHR